MLTDARWAHEYQRQRTCGIRRGWRHFPLNFKFSSKDVYTALGKQFFTKTDAYGSYAYIPGFLYLALFSVFQFFF